jgi:hypothetical protein
MSYLGYDCYDYDIIQGFNGRYNSNKFQITDYQFQITSPLSLSGTRISIVPNILN